MGKVVRNSLAKMYIQKHLTSALRKETPRTIKLELCAGDNHLFRTFIECQIQSLLEVEMSFTPDSLFE